jgi:glycosyltransferase domain-containing protein
MNNDLTILLLLKGRDAFTIRWFEYAKKYAIPYKVIIADGGHDDGLESELCKRKFSQHIDYEYIRYPFDDNYQIFYKKVHDALMRVETPFVVLASDDDFYFFDALATSVGFLKEHPEFVASRGEIWDFNVSSPLSGSRVSGGKDNVYGDMGGVTRLYYQPTVVGDSAIDRVIDFSLKFHSVWHDVVRTDRLRVAYSALLGSDINDFRFYDHFISFFTATNGKIHRGGELYMLHQTHPDMAALTVVGNTSLEWIDSDGWKADLDRFLNGMAGQISEIDKITIHEAKCGFIECYFVNVVLNTMMRGCFSQRIIKTPIVSIIKSILRRNSFIFNVSKKLALRFLGGGESERVPHHFDKKLEDVSKFLKNTESNIR